MLLSSFKYTHCKSIQFLRNPFSLRLMDNFERQFENLDVQTECMDDAMQSTTTMATPQGQVGSESAFFCQRSCVISIPIFKWWQKLLKPFLILRKIRIILTRLFLRLLGVHCKYSWTPAKVHFKGLIKIILDWGCFIANIEVIKKIFIETKNIYALILLAGLC